MEISVVLLLVIVMFSFFGTSGQSAGTSYYADYQKKRAAYSTLIDRNSPTTNISVTSSSGDQKGQVNVSATPIYRIPVSNVASNMSYKDYEVISSEDNSGSNPLNYQLDYSLVTSSLKMNDYQKISSYILMKYKSVPLEDALQIAEAIVTYSAQVSLDPKLVAAVVAVESEFNKKAISPTGAKGLGQIKDFNYHDLRIIDPFDIGQNVKGTAFYLREKFSHWKKEEDQLLLGFASYYEGYNSVKRAGKKVREDTKQYVEMIMKRYSDICSPKWIADTGNKNKS